MVAVLAATVARFVVMFTILIAVVTRSIIVVPFVNSASDKFRASKVVAVSEYHATKESEKGNDESSEAYGW